MYKWIVNNGFRPVIIATKLDKLKRSEVAKCVKVIKETLNLDKEDILIPFSAENKTGRDEIYQLIDTMLGGDEEQDINL
jgi:GTP-binding protein